MVVFLFALFLFSASCVVGDVPSPDTDHREQVTGDDDKKDKAHGHKDGWPREDEWICLRRRGS